MYKKERRIPLSYFNTLLKKADAKLSEQEIASLKVMSGSGKGKLPAILPVTKDLGTLLGYIAAEGCINQDAIRISNLDADVRTIIQKACQDMGVLNYSTPTDIVISDRPFIALVYALGGSGRSGIKHVPGELFSFGKKAIVNFISNQKNHFFFTIKPLR